MNVVNFANLFQPNSIFQQNRLGQGPAQPLAIDALNRLSKNMSSPQDRAKELKARFDTVELSAEAVQRRGDDSIEELPEDVLRYFLDVYRTNSYQSQQHEASLIEYRDQLSAFDQTIQSYQDMLDGKAALPEQMGREDVSRLLDAARTAREEFLQKGAAVLNRLSKNDPSRMGYMFKDYSAGTNQQRDEFDTWIDTSAEDIYGEIDRALGNARNVTSTFEEWASNIQSELKRRGCEQELRMVDREAVADAAVAQPSLFQSIYEDVWNILRRSTGGGEASASAE